MEGFCLYHRIPSVSLSVSLLIFVGAGREKGRPVRCLGWSNQGFLSRGKEHGTAKDQLLRTLWMLRMAPSLCPEVQLAAGAWRQPEILD